MCSYDVPSSDTYQEDNSKYDKHPPYKQTAVIHALLLLYGILYNTNRASTSLIDICYLA